MKRLSIILIAILFALVVIGAVGAGAPLSTPRGAIYLKSRLGFMPAAYGMDKELVNITRLLAQSGFFTTHISYTVGSWAEVTTIAELTGDDRRDAAVATSIGFDADNDNRLHLFVQQPAGTLTRTLRYTTEQVPSGIAHGDLNADGLTDVAVSHATSDTISVFWQEGGGGLSAMQVYTAGRAPDGVAVGDFNGDCLNDVAVSYATEQYIGIYYQNPVSALAEPITIPVSSAGFNEIAAGDIDGDGDDDVVMLRGAGQQADTLALFYQENWQLQEPVYRTVYAKGYAVHGLALGDVTGDGRTDVIATAGGNVPDAWISVFTQNNDGVLATTPITYPAYHLPEAVEVADVNHDGRADVVVAHAAWMALSVYTQTVYGTLDTYRRDDLPYVDHYQPQGLAIGDLNSDGGADVALADRENGLVVLTNLITAPVATMDSHPACTILDVVSTTLTGTIGADTIAVEVRVVGVSDWTTATINGGEWQYEWVLPTMEQYYQIQVRAINSMGKVQWPYAARRMGVENGPPAGSVVINDGAACTNQTMADLTLRAFDVSGVAEMRFSDNDFTFTDWMTYANSFTGWPLSAGDVLKTVYAQYKDMLGKSSASYTDTITLDTAAPVGSVVMADGQEYTAVPEVSLILEADDSGATGCGVSQMQLSHDGWSYTSWLDYRDNYNWTLTALTDGTKAVYVRYRDHAGNDSIVYTDSIILDTAPPTGTITINGGDAYASAPTVTLTLWATDTQGMARMQFSHDGVIYSDWISYTDNYIWTLVARPDGAKTVYAQYEDVAGNVSAPCTNVIILDTTPPSSSVQTLPEFQTASSFQVDWIGTDDLSGLTYYDVQYKDGAAGGWTDWLTATTATSATFSGDSGHTYYFRSRAGDYAGNLENYPDDPGDAFTTICAAIAGADFSPRDVEVLRDTPVVFTGSVTTGTLPVTYVWNFADGSPEKTGETVTHTYAAMGFFAVVMTATNDCDAKVVTGVITVTTIGELVAEKTVSQAEAPPGTYLVYTVTITNIGEVNVPDALMTDTLPAAVTLSAGPWASTGSATHAGGVITWRGAVSVDESVTVSYQVRVAEDASIDDRITNDAIFYDGMDEATTSPVVVTVVPFKIYMPVIMKNYSQ